MTWPYVQAAHFYKGRNRPLRFIVIHSMEVPDGPQTAENVARYFADPHTQASAHICCDENSVVQCVHGGDTAWGAKGANADGFHIEIAGRARMTRDEWLADDKVLNIAACVAAEAINAFRYFGTPVLDRWLTIPEIEPRRLSGLVTHADITHAFHIPGGHTDPGGNFPKDVFIDKVRWWVPHITSIDFR